MEQNMDQFPEQKTLEMAGKVHEETNLLEGDRTREWSCKAVKVLSRIARKHGCYDQFYEAVMNQDSNTRCCPAHDEKIKGTSRAVMFLLKVFRFPCLRHKNQFKSVLFCRHQYSPDNRQVCLNPWHYRWIELPRHPIPPIMVKKNRDYGEPPARQDDPFQEEMALDHSQIGADGVPLVISSVPNVTMQGDEIKILYDRHAAQGITGDLFYPTYGGSVMPFEGGAQPANFAQSVSNASTVQNYYTPTSPPADQVEQDEERNYYRSGMSSPASNIPSPAVFIPRNNAPADQEDDDMDVEIQNINEDGSNGNEDHPRARPTYPDGRPITPIEPRPLYRTTAAEVGQLVRNAPRVECVEYHENPYWLRIIYYEEQEKVGHIQQFSSQHCLVDGFSSSSVMTERGRKKSRFSIGFYTNPLRTKTTSDVRSLVGKGIRFYLLAGEVYIENLGSIPIFIQSICANMKNGFPLNTVSKLPAEASMKAFDMRMFSKKLAAAAEKTYQDVYCLSRMCTLRMSFCKGWGEHYRRPTVVKSPVWFQIHLNNPMAWIDSVLTCMGAPPRLCSSRT